MTPKSAAHRINKKKQQMLRHVFGAYPHMSRPIKHSLRWISAFAAAALFGGLLWQSAAPAQVPATLPVVREAAHKSYVEKLTD